MKKFQKQNLLFSTASQTPKTWTFTHDGKMEMILFTIPAYTNVVTVTLSITNSDSKEVYNSGAKAKGASYVMLLDHPTGPEELMTITATISGDPNSTGNCELTLYAS